MITFASVCSGIEAASVAWEPLGMRALWLSEIDAFPSAVLAHHWPNVANLGDMCRLSQYARDGLLPSPDILIGGTPCQSFSIAGDRLSLSDPRGELTLKYVELCNELQPKVIVWENVPGVLNTKDNAFGCFLGALVGSGCELHGSRGKWPHAGYVVGPERTVAWRVLDAQYFGVAQRRRRVFVVASPHNGIDPGQVLFESEGVRRDIAPSRETGQEVAAYSAESFGNYRESTLSGSLRASSGRRGGSVEEALVVHGTQDPIVNGNLAVPLARNSGRENAVLSFAQNSRGEVRLEGGDGQRTGALSSGGGKPGQGYPCVVAFQEAPASVKISHQTSTLDANNSNWHNGALVNGKVRRLLPLECERLQGFPDNFTQIPYKNKPANECKDGPRYTALGNSMVVPVIRWIGSRIVRTLESG